MEFLLFLHFIGVVVSFVNVEILMRAVLSCCVTYCSFSKHPVHFAVSSPLPPLCRQMKEQP